MNRIGKSWESRRRLLAAATAVLAAIGVAVTA